MHHSDPYKREAPSLLALALTFLKVGMFAYGGWSGAMLMVRREVVEGRGWITEDELGRSLTYSQLLPGSTAVGIISGSGFRILGWKGLVVATLAYLLPPTLLMAALSAAYFRFNSVPSLAAPLNGVYAALAGLLLANVWQLARTYNGGMWWLWALSGLVLLSHLVLGISFAPLVIAGGFLGVLCLSLKRDGGGHA